MVLGGFSSHETSTLGPNALADVGAHGREAAASLVFGGKIVGDHGVAVMGEPGTDVDGLGGSVVPKKYGAGVAGTVAERILGAMYDYHRQRRRRDAASGGRHHPDKDTG